MAKRSRNKMGKYHEHQAERELKKHLTSLVAWVVPGSGNQAHRDGGTNPGKVGDVQVKTKGGRIAECIEVKSVDPMRRAGEITIAEMNGWRKGRRILMCCHDLGEFLCSMPVEVWDWFTKRTCGGDTIIEPQCSPRGVSINTVLAVIGDYNYSPPVGIRYDDIAVYMDPQTLCYLLEQAHGEGVSDG